MHNQTETPWYKLERYDDKLPDKLSTLILASVTDRKGELLDAALMAWFYERDRWNGESVKRCLGPAGYSRYQKFTGHDEGASVPAMNQIKSAIDTLVSQMLADAPTLRVRTANASYEILRQHEIRSRALMGALASPKTKEAEFMWARDGLIKRVGWACPRYSTGQLLVQRLHPFQVFYDARDAMHGDISQIHVAELIERDHFLAWYSNLQSTSDNGKATQAIPGKAKRIETIEQLPRAHGYVDGGDAAWQGAYGLLLSDSHTHSMADRVRVVYSWRKSWRAGKPEGRAMVTVYGGQSSSHTGKRSVVALDVPFSRSDLPPVQWSPWRANMGINGISMVDLLLPTQLAIDRSIFKIQRMQDKYGHHKLITPWQADEPVVSAFMEHGVKLLHVKGSDEVPQLIEGHVLSQSQMSWLEWLVTQPVAMTGTTQGALEGRSELGPAASGIARIEEKFQKRDRQNVMRDSYARARIGLGTQILNVNDDAVRLDKDYAVSWTVNAQLISRPWATLQLSNNAYVVDIDERGILGDSKAGQIQKLIEYANQGLIDNDIVTNAIMREPDVGRWASMALAPFQAIEDHLAILSDPDAEDEWPNAQPTEDMNLELANKLATLTINQAMAQHATDDTIARLSAYKLAVIRTTPPEVSAAPAPPQLPV